MKYVDTKVVMQEVPDEITLAINISNCPCHCKSCHSSYLAEDIGEDLSIERLTQLSTEAEGITCFAFMGGDADPKRINRLAKWVKERLDLKVCWYSGRDEISDEINLTNFDYIKIGHYDKEAGPLYKPTTNQRMYKVSKFFVNRILVDITDRFWNKDLN